MSWFSPETFAQAVLEGPRRHASAARTQELATRLDELERDVHATIVTLAAERDPRSADKLREDLALFLPARRAALNSVAISTLATDNQAAFRAALDVLVQTVIAVARAFVTRGL
jgi:hypothetical protein